MKPDLRHLAQFVAVAECGGFGTAAIRLGMAQPPLSQAIRKLEEQLGIRLFVRTSRRVTLTQAGHELLVRARPLINQHAQVLEQIRDIAAGRRGRVRICFVMSAGYTVLPLILRQFREIHPTVEVATTEATTSEQVDALSSGQQDVGLLRPPIFGGEKLTVRTILAEPIVAALPRSHRLGFGGPVELAALRDESFIAPPASLGPGLHARLIDLCLTAGFVPRIEHEAREMVTIASLVAAGLGVALVPASLAQLGMRGIVYRPLGPSAGTATFDLALACRAGAERDRPSLKALLEVAGDATRFLEQPLSNGV